MNVPIVRVTAKTVDMVPQLQHNSLISGGKFADANYITVLTPKEVLIHDGKDTHMSVTKGPILKGWRYTTYKGKIPTHHTKIT